MIKKIKIANGQGFWGDSYQAPRDLVNRGNIDYLTLDYLAEVTMSIMQRQKLKNPNSGYAIDFIELIEDIASDIQEKNIKIISNAGGVNPKECSNKLKEIIRKKNLSLKIGYIEGDDILEEIDNIISEGVNFNNMDTGEEFNSIRQQICSANVYINSYSIKDALDLGADIVLAGRVADPGLCLGPLLHEYGWKENEYNKLASGTLAGHIIECGAQCSGGNHTKWMDVPNLSNIGYPIIEMKSNGDFNVIKQHDTGGLINKFTISEQILYEMGDPRNYISPDVCVDFTSFNLSDKGNNKVSIKNTIGMAPTDTYKVSISYFAGYKSSAQLTISAPNALKKAQCTAEIIWDRLKRLNCTFENTNTEYLGLSSCHQNLTKTPDTINEIVLRLSVKDSNKRNIEKFSKEIFPVITNGPPGITGFASGRPKVQEIIAYWPTLIPKKLIKTIVRII